MCVHTPRKEKKVSKTTVYTFVNGTQTGLCLSRGWLRNSSLGVLAAVSVAIIRAHEILTFFPLFCVRLLFILFSMTECVISYTLAAAPVWRFLDGVFFFFDFTTLNPPPYKTVQLHLPTTKIH